MLRSKVADQPYSDVVKTHGESTSLSHTHSPSQPGRRNTFVISIVNGFELGFQLLKFFLRSFVTKNPISPSLRIFKCSVEKTVAAEAQQRHPRVRKVEVPRDLACATMNGEEDTMAMLSPVKYMSFSHSFLQSTYTFKLSCSSPDFEMLSLNSAAILVLMMESTWIQASGTCQTVRRTPCSHHSSR